MNQLLSNSNEQEVFFEFKRRIVKYILLIVFNTLIFICYSILDVVNIKYTVANPWWGGLAIVNIITSPLFLIVFILSEDGKMKLIKDVLCCKKEETSNDIEIRLSESSTQ